MQSVFQVMACSAPNRYLHQPIYWPFVGAVYRWLIQWLFFHTKGQQRGKRFYVLMSSWRRLHQGNIVNWLVDSEWRMNASVNYTMNVSDYGLSPNRHQNNIWTLICALIELFRTHFSNISIEIHKFSVRKTCFKMPVQWRPFCLGLNVLRMFAC